MGKSVITLYCAGPIEYKAFTFSGGEVQVRFKASNLIPTLGTAPTFEINAQIVDSDGIMELLLLTDAIRRHYGRHVSIFLFLPYVPYARQDRVCAPGEALALKVFADLINAQRYESVIVHDVHSDVALALIERVRHRKQVEFVRKIQGLASNTQLIAPDAGAMKKIFEVGQAMHLEVIQATKVRDVHTGEITGTHVYSDHLGETDVLIVDDICDGGRTFLELAPALREITTGRVMLYVTHGIFSRGVEVFEGVIDKVYCPNVFPGVPDHPLLERL